MGGQIAQLNWTIDAAGEHWLKMLTDFPRGKVYLITSERFRRWRIALETQDPEVNVAAYNGAGTPTIYTACIDPRTGHILMQCQPGGPNAIPIRKFDHDTGALLGSYGGTGALPSWPTSLWGNSHIVCVQAGTASFIVGVEGQTAKGFVVRADDMSATTFYQTLPTAGGFMTVGASGPSGGEVYFCGLNTGNTALVFFKISITAGGAITQSTIATITAASWDSPNVIPAYNNISCNSMDYDHTDGNLLVSLHLLENTMWAQITYFAKISATDGHVIWMFPLVAIPWSFPVPGPGQIPPGQIPPAAVGGVVPGTVPPGSPPVTGLWPTPPYSALNVTATTLGFAAGGGTDLYSGATFGIMDSTNGSFISRSDNLSGVTASNIGAQLGGNNLSGYSAIPTPDGTMFISMGGYGRGDVIYGGSAPTPVAGTPDSITGPYGFFIFKPEPEVTPVAYGCDPRTLTSLKATWTYVPEYYNYLLFWRHSDAAPTDPWSGNIERVDIVGDVASYTISGLDYGVSYDWMVRVYGDAFTTHQNSNVVTCPAPPLPPPIAYGCDPRTQTSLTAYWYPYPTATHYTFEFRATATLDTWVTIGLGNVTSYTLSGLTPGTSYTWRVYASNPHWLSPPSNLVTCPAPSLWEITSKSSAPGEGGIGDVWMDQRYVDFSDISIRRRFINADKTWVNLGYYGELPYDTVETYPLVWNTIHFEQGPTDFLSGWGQNGNANRWSIVANGNDPTTNVPYPAMAIDECKPPPPQWKITSEIAAPGEGGIGDLWMDQRYVDFSDPTTRQKFIGANKMWVDFGFYGEKPLGTYPLVWNTVQSGNDPTDFIYGYGQHGGAPGWNVVATGNDPTTNAPYPDMAFDICLAPLPPLQPVAMLN